MEHPPGALEANAVIAERVKELRRDRGWSAEKLAAEMTTAGVPWSRVVVTKLETKRRPGVSVAELLALAHVLYVHPVDLLLPAEADDATPYAVAPDVTTTVGRVREWIGGRGFLKDPESPAELAEAIRHMPKERAQEVARAWLTPQHVDVVRREADSIRRQNEAIAEGERAGRFWPSADDLEQDERKESDG